MKPSVIEILQKLLTYPSITPKECGIFDYVRSLLEGFEAIEVEHEGVKNLLLYRRFGEGEHWCLAGHIDVVPPGEGWSVDPFGAELKEGYLYGRGAQDMKSGVAAMISALAKIDHFPGTLSLLLTSDEEGEAKWGTQLMLEHLKERGFLPKVAIVTEPTSEERFGDTIKVGRRGSINGKLIIHGKQGHVAYPSKCLNPVELIAPRLAQIAGYNLDAGDEFFEPSKLVITDIRGGIEAVNVTPSDLKILFNVRHSTQTSAKEIEDYLHQLLQGIPYTLEIKPSSKPFLTSRESVVVKRVSEAVKRVMGVAPKLSTGGGTSDARYFAQFGVEVVECGVVNDRIHALDERVALLEVEALERVLLEALG